MFSFHAHQSLKFIPPPLIRFHLRRPAPFPSQATGLGTRGNDEKPIACEVGTKGFRGNAVPFNTTPHRGQGGKNSIELWVIKQRWRILHDCDSWSKIANDAEVLTPQPSFVWGSFAVSGNTDRLAWRSAAHDINILEVVSATTSDIPFSADIWPRFFKSLRCIVINLNLPFADHSGPLESKIKATYASE
jgi:hypothetical protein